MRKCTNKFDKDNGINSNTVIDIRNAKYKITNQR